MSEGRQSLPGGTVAGMLGCKGTGARIVSLRERDPVRNIASREDIITMESQSRSKGRIEALREHVAYGERAKQVMNRIHAAKDLDQIFVELQDEVLSLFDAEHLTLYAMDYDKREIYSKFLDLDEVKEIRVPLNEQSIVGFVARNRKTVNIDDAYNTAELTRISPTLTFD